MNLSAITKVEMTPKFDAIARGYATALMGVGIASYLIRDAVPSLARLGFFMLAMVTNSLVTIVGIRTLLRGEENSSAWITVLLTAFLLVWSAMLWSKDRELALK